MAEIRLRGLTKKFGSVLAVDNVDLHVKNGELLALLGPSGCGKTTTLLMLAGIYKPTRGEILFDDVKVNDVPPRGRGVGVVFQSYALYPHMTVYDNIAFPLRLRRRSKKEIDRRVRDVAKMARIDDLLQRRPNQLSGGQQQRVALCRALVREPSLLLLDEPLSNLDARLRIETRTEIKRLQQEFAITTILVTHDQVEAMTMADRVAVMRDGKIEQVSSPSTLYKQPESLFVASFIGDPPMNLLQGKWTVRGGKGCLIGPQGREIPLPAGLLHRIDGLSTEQPVIFGIRPENVRIHRERRDGAVRASVFMTELLGRDTLVNVRYGNEHIRALVSGETSFDRGQPVWLTFEPDAVHLFDEKTKKRLPVGKPKMTVA